MRSDPPVSVADSLETAQNLELIPDNLVPRPVSPTHLPPLPFNGAQPADGKTPPNVYDNKGLENLVPRGLGTIVSGLSRWIITPQEDERDRSAPGQTDAAPQPLRRTVL